MFGAPIRPFLEGGAPDRLDEDLAPGFQGWRAADRPRPCRKDWECCLTTLHRPAVPGRVPALRVIQSCHGSLGTPAQVSTGIGPLAESGIARGFRGDDTRSHRRGETCPPGS